MSDAVLILCTVATPAEAETIARTLIQERLAACVQISAIDSWYRWQGEVEHAPEQRLQIKTIAALVAQVEARINALHNHALRYPREILCRSAVRQSISRG